MRFHSLDLIGSQGIRLVRLCALNKLASGIEGGVIKRFGICDLSVSFLRVGVSRLFLCLVSYAPPADTKRLFHGCEKCFFFLHICQGNFRGLVRKNIYAFDHIP